MDITKLADLSEKELEAIGKNLTLAEGFALLDYAAATPQFHWKLSPLLVGMPHALFSQLLDSATLHQMEVLKLEAITEPVQHQLSLVSHEITHRLSEMLNQLDQISLDVASGKDPGPLRIQLLKQSEWYQNSLHMITKVLSLAWNSKRPDLIDKLSHAREQCQRALLHGIGKPKTIFGEATGLFAKLEEGQAAIYVTDNDEPALEGLTTLSLWYLNDYQQIGLLPGIAILDLDPATHTEEERLAYREELLEKVRKNLAALGLHTVKDLKDAGIYSADDLRAHIERLLEHK